MNKTLEKQKSKIAKRREALQALMGFGYWDFIAIESALEMAEDYLREHNVPMAVSTPERCAEIRDMVANLREAVRALRV